MMKLCSRNKIYGKSSYLLRVKKKIWLGTIYLSTNVLYLNEDVMHFFITRDETITAAP